MPMPLHLLSINITMTTERIPDLDCYEQDDDDVVATEDIPGYVTAPSTESTAPPEPSVDISHVSPIDDADKRYESSNITHNSSDNTSPDNHIVSDSVSNLQSSKGNEPLLYTCLSLLSFKLVTCAFILIDM